MTDRPRGSALAVDLRRARAARKREQRAAEPSISAASEGAVRTVDCAGREPLDCVREWFASEGWRPFPFQEDVWRAYLAGESGLVHAATGTGKTYAAFMGPVLDWLEHYPGPLPLPRRPAAPPLTVLWITPLRALA